MFWGSCMEPLSGKSRIHPKEMGAWSGILILVSRNCSNTKYKMDLELDSQKRTLSCLWKRLGQSCLLSHSKWRKLLQYVDGIHWTVFACRIQKLHRTKKRVDTSLELSGATIVTIVKVRRCAVPKLRSQTTQQFPIKTCLKLNCSRDSDFKWKMCLFMCMFELRGRKLESNRR